MSDQGPLGEGVYCYKCWWRDLLGVTCQCAVTDPVGLLLTVYLWTFDGIVGGEGLHRVAPALLAGMYRMP